MRDMNERSINSSRAKFKQRIAGGAVLLLILAIFLPFIFSHSHLGETTTPTSDPSVSQSPIAAADPAMNPPVEQVPQPAQAQAEPTEVAMAADNSPASTVDNQDNNLALPPPDTTNEAEMTTVQNESAQALPTPAASVDYKPAIQAQSQPEEAAIKTVKAVKTVNSAERLPLPAAGSWVVQMGSFTEPTYAKQLLAKLRHQGLNAYIQPGANNTFRVYAGPVNSYKQAQLLQQKLKAQFKLNGIIRDKNA